MKITFVQNREGVAPLSTFCFLMTVLSVELVGSYRAWPAVSQCGGGGSGFRGLSAFPSLRWHFPAANSCPPHPPGSFLLCCSVVLSFLLQDLTKRAGPPGWFPPRLRLTVSRFLSLRDSQSPERFPHRDGPAFLVFSLVWFC